MLHSSPSLLALATWTAQVAKARRVLATASSLFSKDNVVIFDSVNQP
jgi:hypothetical protein